MGLSLQSQVPGARFCSGPALMEDLGSKHKSPMDMEILSILLATCRMTASNREEGAQFPHPSSPWEQWGTSGWDNWNYFPLSSWKAQVVSSQVPSYPLHAPRPTAGREFLLV